MKWLADLISLVLLVVYFFGGMVLSHLMYGESIPLTMAAAVCYGMVVIITTIIIFSALPESLQKYFRNKTPDNPDGCVN